MHSITHRLHPWSQKVSDRKVGLSQMNTVLNVIVVYYTYCGHNSQQKTL